MEKDGCIADLSLIVDSWNPRTYICIYLYIVIYIYIMLK